MIGKCPNKNTKEWKDLVVYAGDPVRADALYAANNFEIPSITKLEKEGIKPGVTTVEQQSRFEPLIQKNIQEVQRLNKILARKQADLKTSKNKPTVSKDINRLEKKIAILNETNVTLKKNKALDDIKNYATDDLTKVDNILDKYHTEGITFGELHSTLKTINLWQQSGDFSNNDHLFLTAEEMQELDNPDNEIVQEIRDGFLKWKSQADRLYNKYTEVAKSLLENAIHEQFGDNVEVEVDKMMEDVNILFKSTIDISEVDGQLFQLMAQWTRKANDEANLDVQSDMEDVTEVFDKLRKSGKLEKFKQLLPQKQSNEDSRKTGDFVFRFTQKWHNKEIDIYKKLNRLLEFASQETDPGKKGVIEQRAYAEFRNEINDISTTIDSRKLFADNEMYQEYLTTASDNFEGNFLFSQAEKEAYIVELKDQLGEEGYNHYYNQLQNKLEQYKIDQEVQLEELNNTLEGDQALIAQAMEEWILKFNPFWNSHYAEHGHPRHKIGNAWASSSKGYISTIAKRTDESGQDLGYYDNNFKSIMADSDMKEVYDTITGIFNEYVKFLPPHEVQFFNVNTLPNIRKSILETFTSDGMSSGLQSVWNNVKEATRTDTFAEDAPKDTNEKFVQLDFIKDNKSVVHEYVTVKSIEYQLQNPNHTTQELNSMKDEWTKEIQNKLAGQKSWDIERITKAFMVHSSTFKHKAKIEDAMKVCRNMIDEIVEQQTSVNDKPNYNQISRKLAWKHKDLKHLKDMTDHFMDNFFGYRIKKIEGRPEKIEDRLKKRVFTKEEKQQTKELEDVLQTNLDKFINKEIPEEEFIKNQKIIQSQLDKIGGVSTWGNYADMLIKYMQLKGIGWNVFSAFGNRGFGIISNVVEAAGGQRFTTKELREANTLMKNSIVKNLSFHTINSDTAQKIKAGMTNLDVLKESKNEIFEQKITTMDKRFKFMSPYNMQSRGEYLNQGEIMIAMLKYNKVLVDGKETNMWDAMNKDGTWDENVKPPTNSPFDTFEKYRFDVKAKIDEAVRSLHGNYDYENAPLWMKKTVLGRALAQFRTWAFAGFYDRFGASKDSLITGFEKKGRYLSYNAIFKNLGAIPATMELTKQLLRKLTFQSTKFDELVEEGTFTETDAANLRKNLQEIVMYMIITGVGLMMRAATVDDDDEQDVAYKYLSTFWINQMGRLQTDILFYTNPMEFDKLQRQGLPVFNLVQDSHKLLNHGFQLMTGQTEDIYATGIYSGTSKTKRYGGNVFPFTNQWNKLISVSSQLRD